MAIQMTVKNLKVLLGNVTSDLDKAENGNKAASQRVRTGTVKLEKLAKLYRKESIASEKKGGFKKVAKKPAKKAAAPKQSKPKKVAAAKPKAVKKATSRARSFSLRRPTAKLPSKQPMAL